MTRDAGDIRMLLTLEHSKISKFFSICRYGVVSLESSVILLGGYEYGGYGIVHTTVAKASFQNDSINPEKMHRCW